MLSATNDVFDALRPRGHEINYDSMHQLAFANTKLTPNPDNKAEFLLYDKDDSEQEGRREPSRNKLTGEMCAWSSRKS